MTAFESITRFVVPDHVVRDTDGYLRSAGRAGAECFVLWTGIPQLNNFCVRTAYLPRQTAYRLPEGLCVRIESEELHKLNVWLFERGEQLAIQVHSHPTEAYHSDTDNAYPMVTMRGGLSLVVPDFARAGVRGPGIAGYRLHRSGWTELTEKQMKTLIHFEEASWQ